MSSKQYETNAANRLGLDYRKAPPRRTAGPIIDIHTHLHDAKNTRLLMEAADAYGIGTIYSMNALEHAADLRAAWGERVRFIAVPRWRDMGMTAAFRDRWIADLGTFRELGARLCKFWMAPPMRERHGLTLGHDFLRPVIDAALGLGYEFMTHIADPSVWWRPGARYSDTSRYGTKTEQYAQLEWFLDYVAPRRVIGAHMGGFVEDLSFLQGLLDRHANYLLDTSATKWIVREVSRQPEATAAFVIRNADRVLFGSDLVASPDYDTFDHYASRYWAQRTMWETDYRGKSPIDDPDAENPPRMAGANLPVEVLEKVYSGNARKLE